MRGGFHAFQNTSFDFQLPGKLPGEQKQKMVVQTISCVIHFEQFPLLCHLHKVKKKDSVAIFLFLEENYSTDLGTFTFNLLYLSDLV